MVAQFWGDAVDLGREALGLNEVDATPIYVSVGAVALSAVNQLFDRERGHLGRDEDDDLSRVLDQIAYAKAAWLWSGCPESRDYQFGDVPPPQGGPGEMRGDGTGPR